MGPIYEKFVNDNIGELTEFTYKMVTIPAPSRSEAERAHACMGCCAVSVPAECT